MIRITDKSKCCGCTACVNICPVQCIVMRRDREEGFDYPVANPDICIGCGKCEKVCPVLNPSESSKPLEAYALRCGEYSGASSSGGVFPSLAKVIVDEEGVVFGAVMEDDMKVGHTEAETMDEVERMRGSKYVQSDLYSVFQDVRAYLESGRKVLFTGTPCQVAGLHKYLGGRPQALTTVDIACHGVPGPGLWEMYVKALSKRAGSDLIDVNFRDKSNGWRRYGFRTAYASGPGSYVRAVDDPYMALYMQGMTLRPSCYSCPAKNGRSGSDITIADLWSVACSAPEINDDMGASGVLVNTGRGQELLKGISWSFKKELPSADVMKENGGFAESLEVPVSRTEFFKGLNVIGTDVYEYMESHMMKTPLCQRLWRGMRSSISRLKRKILK